MVTITIEPAVGIGGSCALTPVGSTDNATAAGDPSLAKYVRGSAEAYRSDLYWTIKPITAGGTISNIRVSFYGIGNGKHAKAFLHNFDTNADRVWS